jgi:hypothetical protein
VYPQPQNGPAAISPVLFTYYDDYAAGAASGEWSVDETRINRTYSIRLKAYCASKYAGPLQVIGALPVRIGDSYQFPLTLGATEKDTGSFVQRIHADRDTEAGGLQWTVTVDYGPFDVRSLLGSSQLSTGQINPIERAWEVYWDNAKYRRSRPEDESSPPLPYVNTVGDPLLDVPETEETRPVLNLVRNESTYNDAYASQYKDAVNSDEFLGYPPNTVKCKDIKGERSWDPDWGWYFRVSYQFEFRDDDDGNGYKQMILNAGYRQKVNGSGAPVNVVDSNGQQVNDAVPLQKDGSYKPAAEPYFLTFSEFPSVAFADLNIPDDILYVASGNT